MNHFCSTPFSPIAAMPMTASQAEQHIAWLTDEELYTTLRPLFGSDQTCLDAILINGAEYQAVAGKLLEKFAARLVEMSMPSTHAAAPIKPDWRMRLAGSFHIDDGADAVWAAMMQAAAQTRQGGAA